MNRETGDQTVQEPGDGGLEMLATLASGRLDPAVALFISAALNLRGRPDGAGEAIAGVCFEAEAPAAMAPDALERAFAAIDGSPSGETRRGSRPDPGLVRLPPVLKDVALEAELVHGWSGPMPGIRTLSLPVSGGVHAEVLRIDAGVAAPRHRHEGREYTLCLAGGFSDGRGSYGPGDICAADPDVTHQPRADVDGPCYVLAITDGELRFTGVLGVLQRLFAGPTAR